MAENSSSKIITRACGRSCRCPAAARRRLRRWASHPCPRRANRLGHMSQLATEAVEASLAQRIAEPPMPLAPSEAQARVAHWLNEIAATPAGPILAGLFAEHPRAAALMAAIADGSPFLWELGRAEPTRL